jgi:hypothetical protein
VIDPFGNRHWPEPYLQPRQIGAVPPTHYENLLADALESAFGAGVWDLPALVARLDAEGVRLPTGEAFTEATLAAELKRLGGG